jgi:hypothetical protein
MQIFSGKFASTLLTSAMLSVAIAMDVPKVKAFSLIREDLFFGRNIANGGQVSEDRFQAFVDSVITPSFPDGLTIFDTDGQFLDSMNAIVEEPSKVVTLFVEDTPKSKLDLNEVVASYLQQFNQESVLQVTNKDELKVAFDAGENLIDNNPTPEFIETDLFFGRNISGGGVVSQEQFQAFVDNVITPRFPDGLTIFDTDGQFKDSTGAIVQEPSKVVRLLLEDTTANETAIDEIVASYIEQFNQQSVLIAVNEDVVVGFDAGENLIDNDPIPEAIETELFFGRNIPGGGVVSEEQFQAFIDEVITPRFPAGLTIFDAQGQFKDSTGTIIEESSKVVTLLLEDTVENEAAIDEIVRAYREQFNQESVLLVVDEDVDVAFDAAPSTVAVPENKSAIALFLFSILSVVVGKRKIVQIASVPRN